MDKKYLEVELKEKRYIIIGLAIIIIIFSLFFIADLFNYPNESNQMGNKDKLIVTELNCSNKSVIDRRSCFEYDCSKIFKGNEFGKMDHCEVCNSTEVEECNEVQVEADCECYEESCPLGSRWLDGSRVCYNSNKQMGIVEGNGCKKYKCGDLLFEVK